MFGPCVVLISCFGEFVKLLSRVTGTSPNTFIWDKSRSKVRVGTVIAQFYQLAENDRLNRNPNGNQRHKIDTSMSSSSGKGRKFYECGGKGAVDNGAS